LGVSGPFKSLQMTPPTRSIGAFSPVSFFDWCRFECFSSAQTTHFFLEWSVIEIPECGSREILSTVSNLKWPKHSWKYMNDPCCTSSSTAGNSAALIAQS
ncbi:hypothetical protein PHMEG_00035276, partial [Phytophthora megakarya]